MTTTVRRAAWFAAGLALLVLASGGRGGARADDAWNHAGLVVRHGDGRIVYAYVAFPEDSIDGVELLRRSGLSLVTIAFGGLGEGVCTLDDEGCPASECRRRVCQAPGADAPFWQYFRQDGGGVWTTMALGASATAVRDGDIDGWSWTGRDAGLPPLTLDEIARLAGVLSAEATVAPDAPPTPAVRTVYPAGMGPSGRDANTTWRDLGVGLGLVGGVAAATLVVARSRTRGRRG